MYRRARPHGLAAGVGIQLACSGGGRYRALEMRYWRRAAFTNGWATGDRSGHRGRRAEPNAGAGTPGVRPHRMTRNTGRAQYAHTADPCNKVAEYDNNVRMVFRTGRILISGDAPAGMPPFGMIPRQGGWLARLPPALPLPAWLTETDVDYYTNEFSRTGFRGGLNWYRNIDRNWELLAPF